MRSIPSPGLKRNFDSSNDIEAFLQQDGLPFSNVISSETISTTFKKYSHPICGTIYTHAVVLRAFPSQVLRDGKEACLQSAVARIIAHATRLGKSAPSADTGDYCRARAGLPEAALKELVCLTASQAEENAPEKLVMEEAENPTN